MEIIKQFYQVTFLGETSELLTPEEFAQLQQECKEIYEYGKDEVTLPPFEAYVYKSMQPPDVKPELTVPDPVIEAVPGNREKLLEKSAHKGIQEVVKTAMAVDALKERVDKMEPSNTKKDIAPYVKMHEEAAVVKMGKTRDKPVPYDTYAEMIKGGKTRKEMIDYIVAERGVSEHSAKSYYARAKTKAVDKLKSEWTPSEMILFASDQTKCTPPQCREIATWRLGLNDDQLALLAKQFGGYVKPDDVIKAYRIIKGDALKTHEVAI